jgi:hypothetical protein
LLGLEHLKVQKEGNIMGYTHYYERDNTKVLPQADWHKVQKATNQIVKKAKAEGTDLRFEYDDPRGPYIDGDIIRFNGAGDEGHETFLVNCDEEGFNFCKTAYKPYDLYVCLTLLAINELCPGAFKISSDGEWGSDWEEARSEYRKLFSEDPACPWGY